MTEENLRADTTVSLPRALFRGGVFYLVGIACFFAPALLDEFFIQGAPRPGQAVTTAEVLAAREGWSGSSSSSKSVDRISYHYRIDGAHYCSSGRVLGDHEGGASSVCAKEWEQVNQATVDAYQQGDAIKVFYALERPWISSPAQSPHRRRPWLLVGIFLLAIGGLVTWASWRGPFDFTKPE